ncbi:SCO family protein [Acidisoma cellulosilytica]|uniref:SCO family protein n=1 Tax=Acidisoma cellulosilyticum TaxID=2802395 RepID=A0A964E7B6_9PROT|nr:SCO family protein [Acidisoma cellulosilyticum]MCB8883833.1 SCO family protein [Acidisoma cellulosilyticum]
MAKTRPTKPVRGRPAKLTAGLILVAIFAVAIGLYALIATRERQSLAETTIGGRFALVDSANHTVTDRTFRGQYMLVYFGYTDCPDICPTTLTAVTQALAQLGPRGDDIQPIFITVDPKRDRPSVIGRYTAAFSPRLIGLTGSLTQIHHAETAYHVVVEPGSNAADDAALINHSAVLYLMAPDGRFVAPLPADSTAAVLAADLARLIH